MITDLDVKQNLSPVWTRIFSIEADHAQGCYIYDTQGNKYLDFTCGIGVTNTGHCHPKVVEAVQYYIDLSKVYGAMPAGVQASWATDAADFSSSVFS